MFRERTVVMACALRFFPSIQNCEVASFMQALRLGDGGTADDAHSWVERWNPPFERLWTKGGYSRAKTSLLSSGERAET
jgi:hypothetical protein